MSSETRTATHVARPNAPASASRSALQLAAQSGALWKALFAAEFGAPSARERQRLSARGAALRRAGGAGGGEDGEDDASFRLLYIYRALASGRQPSEARRAAPTAHAHDELEGVQAQYGRKAGGSWHEKLREPFEKAGAEIRTAFTGGSARTATADAPATKAEPRSELPTSAPEST